jgi:hypothetical protein
MSQPQEKNNRKIASKAKAALRMYEQWISEPVSTRDLAIGLALVGLVMIGLSVIVIFGMDSVQVPSHQR